MGIQKRSFHFIAQTVLLIQILDQAAFLICMTFALDVKILWKIPIILLDIVTCNRYIGYDNEFN